MALPRPPRPLRALARLAALVAVVAWAPASAQYAEGGARSLAMGRAGAALGAQPWGHLNPAARAGLDQNHAALQASQSFGLSELRLGSLAAAVPTAVGVLGLEARTFGFSERRETRVRAGIARPVELTRTRTLDVGVAVGVESAATERFGSETALLLDVGVQGEVLPQLRAGLSARNLLGLGGGDDADLRRSAAAVPGLTVGLAYAASDRATLVVDADHDLDFGLSVRAGAEFLPVPAVALRTGVSTEPVRFTGGVGVVSGPVRADVAVELHETLGLTPAFGLEVSF